MGSRLLPVREMADILPRYRNTPIERLLRFHNLGDALPATTGHAELLIGMCMDHRKDLTVPNEFAYVLRAAGGNLRDSEFEVSYAVAVGGVRALALLGHSDCGMADVTRKRERFIRGMVETGWEAESADQHFSHYAQRYEIGDPVEFVVREARRFRRLYPSLLVAPLFYEVEGDRLAQVAEESVS